jgi:hypothetical protein
MMTSQAKWYRGDFHAHTNCSDGELTPPELVALAKAEHLDFLAITDHNTTAAFSKLPPDPSLLIMRGIEITLRAGDFNVFGVDKWFDWMDQICVTTKRIGALEGKYTTTTDLMRQISAQGLVQSMNHPLLKPWEWRDHSTEMCNLNCLEIWNDPSWPDNARENPRALSLWTDLLNAGYRIAGIGGSDYHRPAPRPGEVKPPERLGLPSTFVLASELSSSAILESIRRRRAYVTMGPQVSFQARTQGNQYEIGDEIGEYSGPLELGVNIRDVHEPAQLRIVKNGQLEFASEVRVKDESQFNYQTRIQSEEAAWFRVELYCGDSLQAITNPIFGGSVNQPFLRTFGDFVHED